MAKDKDRIPELIREDESAAYIRPICLLIVAAFYALIFTGGAIWHTGPVSFGVLFATLWIVMVVLSRSEHNRKSLIMVLLSLPAGALFSIARYFISDGPAGILLTLGGLLVIASLTVGMGMHKTHKGILRSILAAGVWLRLSFIVIIPYFAMCNDVGEFKYSYNIFHSGYIQFIDFAGRLPYLDVREFGEWYHPPYYHFAASWILALQRTLTPSRAENWEGIRALTFLCSSLTLFFAYRITGFLKMTRGGRKAAAALLAFVPAFIMMSGNLNNDSMCLMFTLGAVCLIFDWKDTGRYTVLVIAALFMGLAVGTKLSGAVAAPAVLAVIIAGCVASFREKRYARGIVCPVLYGIISLPVGLWFYIRNYISFGMPLTYVLRPNSDYMYLGDIPFVRKLIPDTLVTAEDCFFHNGLEGAPDHSIPVVLCKTGLFNEAIMRDQMTTAITGYVLFLLFACIMVLAAAGMIYGIFVAARQDRSCFRIALIILAAVNIIMYLKMNYDYPYACTMNMRYVLPACVAGCIGVGDLYGYLSSRSGLAGKILKILIAAFMAAVVAFYAGCAVYFV